MTKWRGPIKFFTTLVSTVYFIFLAKVAMGSVQLSGSFFNLLNSIVPQDLAHVDTFIYLAALPLLLAWVLVKRLLYLSEDERAILLLQELKAKK